MPLIGPVPNTFGTSSLMESAKMNANYTAVANATAALDQYNVGILRGALRWSLAASETAIGITYSGSGSSARALTVNPAIGASLTGTSSILGITAASSGSSNGVAYFNCNLTAPILLSSGNALLTAENTGLTITHAATPTAPSLDLSAATGSAVMFPLMTTFQRTTISAQPTGTGVYDTDFETLWFWDGSAWVNSVVPDNTTIEYSSNTLRLKDQGLVHRNLPTSTGTAGSGTSSISFTTTYANQDVLILVENNVTLTAGSLMTFRVKVDGTTVLTETLRSVAGGSTQDYLPGLWWYTVPTPGTFSLTLTSQVGAGSETSVNLTSSSRVIPL